MILKNDDLKKQLPVTVILDNIRSALNVGAIFRSSDATDIHKLILGGITPYPPHNKIPKTALGSTQTVNWEHTPNTIESISKLKDEGNKIISIEISKESKNIYEYEFPFPSAIIFGHEIFGVSKEVLKMSDETIHIPMFGTKESLNVATTVGIVLYELIRQYYYDSSNRRKI
jgi:23S rRNA (guanosine2251-2'-O)-methyltransferase